MEFENNVKNNVWKFLGPLSFSVIKSFQLADIQWRINVVLRMDGEELSDNGEATVWTRNRRGITSNQIRLDLCPQHEDVPNR